MGRPHCNCAECCLYVDFRHKAVRRHARIDVFHSHHTEMDRGFLIIDRSAVIVRCSVIADRTDLPALILLFVVGEGRALRRAAGQFVQNALGQLLIYACANRRSCRNGAGRENLARRWVAPRLHVFRDYREAVIDAVEQRFRLCCLHAGSRLYVQLVWAVGYDGIASSDA